MKINKAIIKKQDVKTSGDRVKKFFNDLKIVTRDKNKKNLKLNDSVENDETSSASLNPPPSGPKHIVFDGDMRNAFIREILCSFKNYFENLGVHVEYERKDYADFRFGYKVIVEKCDLQEGSNEVLYTQEFIEIKDATKNLINYIFNGENFEVSSCSEKNFIEFEIVSNY